MKYNIKIKAIVIVSSLRMLLIFMMLNKYHLDEVLFVFNEDFELHKKYKIKHYVAIKKKITKFWRLYYKLYFYRFKIDRIPVYGADHLGWTDYFLKYFDFYLIEDGIANFSPKRYEINLTRDIPVFGFHKTVKKIYLTSLENVPSDIRHKVELISLEHLWKTRTAQEQHNILDFFAFNLDSLISLKMKKYILFTQCLSEDRVISEQEKIAIYQHIIKNYDERLLVIKPHPRETTDYQKYFENVFVYQDVVPSELFELLDVNFERVITLFSTAVFKYDRNIVDFYGTRIHDKIYQWFGDIKF
ncbi:glycosyltransferase family 52 [Histophilus somni]|uniref:Lipooligosaccharide sialyltransferase n=1 Tax=Histophilus somni TaxID=731 RepID=A0A9Q7E5L3_HISSO|nr:glycosyltransferase family 52 [Histophilus somni]QQF83253.1 hypothetical protein JFL49_04975 [Histophilus somni]